MILLNSTQMAEFVSQGVLIFPSVIDKDINTEFLSFFDLDKESKDLNAKQATPIQNDFDETIGGPPGLELFTTFKNTVISEILEINVVKGAIKSLVGEKPIYDHHAFHFCPPKMLNAQNNHQDSTIDPRNEEFDIQLFYFPHKVTKEMGGTRYIPSSHLTYVHNFDIGRYQNIRGQKSVICDAGTIIIMHHGIWHGGGRNMSNEPRLMFKLRIQPSIKQELLWDTEDLSEERIKNWNRPIFGASYKNSDDPIPGILTKSNPYFDNDDRIIYINRLKLWRYILGNPEIDVDYWLTRIKI